MLHTIRVYEPVNASYCHITTDAVGDTESEHRSITRQGILSHCVRQNKLDSEHERSTAETLYVLPRRN